MVVVVVVEHLVKQGVVFPAVAPRGFQHRLYISQRKPEIEPVVARVVIFARGVYEMIVVQNTELFTLPPAVLPY